MRNETEVEDRIAKNKFIRRRTENKRIHEILDER